jgi:hypothetical protein
MQLEQLSAELRPRNPWEAMDLGIQMARKRFFKLWGLWWLSALPVTLIASLLLRHHPQFISTAVWWFKPLFEPALLLWLSRALFNEDLDVAHIRSQWWRVTRRRLPGNLSWRRLSAHRSLFMPIAQLEQPDRRGWHRRTRLFTRQFPGGARLTVLGVHFEALLTLGLVFGIGQLIPNELLPDWDFIERVSQDNTLMAWVWSLASILSMSLIAPFYVAGGFALYLTRRTELEAWDIELSFRRWLRRLPHSAAATLVLLTLLGLGTPPDAGAADRAEVERAIHEVLTSQDFGSQQTITRWRLKTEHRAPSGQHWHLDLQLLAQAMELLAWIGAAALLAWLAVLLYRNRHRWPGIKRQAAPTPLRPPPEPLITPVSGALPDDIPGTVRARIEQGDTRAATALLYRASLQVLQQRFGLAISDSSTEQECLREARRQRPPEESTFLDRLTRQWVGIAYAGLHPEAGQVLGLLDDWLRLYGDGRMEAT